MQHFRIIPHARSAVSVLLFGLLCVVTVACSRTPPEQALRAQVTAMQAAIETRDSRDVHGLLAEDFMGNDGLDRRGARQLAAATFLRHRDVSARFGPVNIALRGEGDAIARFSVVATGGSGGLLPDSGQVFDVETGWRLVDGEWRLLSAAWKPRL